MTSSEVDEAPPGSRASDVGRAEVSLLDAVVLFFLLLAFYHVNGALWMNGEISGNVAVAVSVLNEGNVSITPEETPRMFEWLYTSDGETQSIVVHSWRQLLEGELAGDRYRRGEIAMSRHQYQLQPSIRDGEFILDAGIGSALTALPVLAVLHGIFGDLSDYTIMSHYAGKFAAACAVAAAAVLVFLIASRFVTRNGALLTAMMYGLATGAWSLSSQGLWQHGPTQLYLALTLYLLLRWGDAPEQSHRAAGFAGLSAGMAMLCAPAAALVAVVVGGAMALRERRSLLFFAAGFVLFAVLQVLYNQFYLGAFGSLPQLAGARELALQRTGSDSVWTFHLLENFAGLFASPSRGLAIYSPVMLFAGFGAVAVWRNPVYRELRPVAVAAGLAVLVQLCWYDWWGAWAYGSRQLLDASVYLALLLIPVMAWLPGKRVAIGVFSLLAAWSFFVQGLGAFASTGIGWNNREVYRVELSGDGGVQTFVDFEAADVASSSEGTTYLGTHYCDIDTVECRSRLWSLRDNPIGFHLQNYDEQRARKRYMSSFNRLWL